MSGLSGTSGFSGLSGTSGHSGVIGISGFSGTAGTGVHETQVQLLSESFLMDLSGFSGASGVLVGRMRGLGFSPDFNEAIDFSFELPEGIDDSQDIEVNVVWHPKGAEAGNVRMRLEWEVVDVGDPTAPAGPTGFQELTIPTPVSAGIKQEFDFTVPASDILSESESLRFTMMRLASAVTDTYVNDFVLESVVMRYVAGGGAGLTGLSGTSGFSGAIGHSGISGYSGQKGDIGVSGYSGASGYSGLSGISGYSGVGTSGYSGAVGGAGPTGLSGISGYSGSVGGGGTPGGSDGQMQYNNGGLFGGASQVYYDDTNHRVGLNQTSPRHKLHIGGATSHSVGSPFGHQFSDVYSVKTTNNTQTTLVALDPPVTNLNVLLIETQVIGIQSWNDDFTYDFKVNIDWHVVDVNAGTVSTTPVLTNSTAGGSGWGIAFSYASNQFLIKVTGETSHNINWCCSMRITGAYGY